MMVKLTQVKAVSNSLFESSVNSYDGQTQGYPLLRLLLFESSVNSYDGQTNLNGYVPKNKFESSVNSYDGQTISPNLPDKL